VSPFGNRYRALRPRHRKGMVLVLFEDRITGDRFAFPLIGQNSYDTTFGTEEEPGVEGVGEGQFYRRAKGSLCRTLDVSAIA